MTAMRKPAPRRQVQTGSLVAEDKGVERYQPPARIQNPELLAAGRAAIVRAAIELFERKGFYATPVNEIAEHANLTIGALYKYIRSKHDILFLSSEYQTVEIEQSIARWIHADIAPVDAVKHAIDDFARVVDRNRKILVIVYREMHHLEQPARRYLIEQLNRVRRMLIQVLRPVAREGVRTDERTLTFIADSLILGVHMWAVNNRVYSSYLTLDDFIDLHTRLTLRELGAPEEAAARQ